MIDMVVARWPVVPISEWRVLRLLIRLCRMWMRWDP